MVLGMASLPVLAASPVLVQGPQVAITAADLQADSLRMPEEMRVKVLTRPQTVQQIGTNLYVRRVMAEEAKKLGLDKTADVEAVVHCAGAVGLWAAARGRRRRAAGATPEAATPAR